MYSLRSIWEFVVSSQGKTIHSFFFEIFTLFAIIFLVIWKFLSNWVIEQLIKYSPSSLNIFSDTIPQDFDNKKTFLGRVKFNLLTRYFKLDFIALGGINSDNFNQTKNLNIVACAMSSDKKKAGKYIPAFFKKSL